jgi:PadR family transcriptional regulator, regulatory protein PadR
MTTQLKKGIIELCVLKIISDEPLSGVHVIERMKEMLNVNENTVYPILRRLTAQDYFRTHTEKSEIGAPKKVYTLTEHGQNYLDKGLLEWKDFMKDVSTILGGHYDKK